MTRTLTLYNTASRKKEVFKPLNPDNVGIYVCGPTVYDMAHIGNARSFMSFDILVRLLHHLYGKTHVTYVRNLTDVDDKINARAAERGVSIAEVTEGTVAQFHKDVDELGLLRPDIEPRATGHIPQMIAMIERLIAGGHAYEAEGHVLFQVSSMQDYGSLSRRSVEDMVAGARVEVAPYKKDPMDFVLWKPSDAKEPGWESPWGYGRPGWHLECSAMTQEHLGTTFDIHGGGIDLVFPHHENEIAQSLCSNKGSGFARYWLHGGFLQVESEKMSKSLGNFLTIRDFLDEFPGEVLRLQVMQTHYRQPLNWTRAGAKDAMAILERWYGLVEGVEPAADLPDVVLGPLCDDLNTPLAVAGLHELADKAKSGDASAAAGLKSALSFLGFGDYSAEAWRSKASATLDVDPAEIERLIEERKAARAAKNFARSDEIRDELLAKGIQLKDGPEGTTWTVAT